MIRSNTGTTRRPIMSIIITALALIPTHVHREFVAWHVRELHLITDPLGVVPFVVLVPEATVLLDIGMGLMAGVFLAMRARVGWVARLTSIATSSTACIVMCVPSFITTLTSLFAWCFGVRGTLRVYGRGLVDGVGFGFHRLLLKKFREEGNMASDSVGSATGCRGIVELPNAISTGKFMEHVDDAGGVVYIIVGIPTADCLKSEASGKILTPNLR